jgi:LacI family transcriptional regulator
MVGYPLFEPNPVWIMRTFFREFLRRAATHGLGVNAFAAEFGNYESSFTKLLDSGAVDGFVLSSVTEQDLRIDWLMDNNIPFVGFGRTISEHHYPCVALDYAEGGRLVARHVRDLGHERIAHLSSNRQPADTIRFDGIAAELAIKGLEATEIATANFSVRSAEVAADELFDQPDPPTAILCGQDLLTAGVVRAAARRGLEVGRDVVVTGFEDSPLGEASNPSLTSVSFPMEEVAYHCVEKLVSRLQGEPPSTTLVQPELVVRESTSGR